MAKSALYRLKSSLKEAGAIGPNARASLSKKDRKKGRPTAASAKNDLNKKLAHIKDAMNPFEIKLTRQKHDVLGRKTKGVQGKPTLSKQVGEENVRAKKGTTLQTAFFPFFKSLNGYPFARGYDASSF